MLTSDLHIHMYACIHTCVHTEERAHTRFSKAVLFLTAWYVYILCSVCFCLKVPAMYDLLLAFPSL